jgi:Family of unknown function (DUF6098)
MRMINSLEEMAELLSGWDDPERELFVRWSRHIERDVEIEVSRDELTGVELPGLSANSLHVEAWWQERPLTAWIGRRLYDYRHLRETRGAGTRPYILAGVEVARGPDNEPLIADCVLVAEVAMSVIDSAADEVDRLGGNWGPLSRTS